MVLGNPGHALQGRHVHGHAMCAHSIARENRMLTQGSTATHETMVVVSGHG